MRLLKMKLSINKIIVSVCLRHKTFKNDSINLIVVRDYLVFGGLFN